LFAVGLQQKVFASPEEDSTTHVTKDICWRADIKHSLKKNIAVLLDDLNAKTRGHYYSMDDVISSPRTISLEDFSLVSIDENTGSVVCNAMLSVTYKSRKYGTIVVPHQNVNFKIREAENGQEAAVTFHDLEGYIDVFGDKLRAISTSDADDEHPGS